MKEKPWRW